jgi:hypothetical protein
MAAEQCLVKVEAGKLLQAADGQEITVCDTPSFALHMSYAAADQWVQRLRKRGFPESVVVDIYGSVMRYADVRAHVKEQAEATLPKSRKELDAMVTGEVKRRYQNEPAFRQRVDELWGTGQTVSQ